MRKLFIQGELALISYLAEHMHNIIENIPITFCHMSVY